MEELRLVGKMRNLESLVFSHGRNYQVNVYNLLQERFDCQSKRGLEHHWRALPTEPLLFRYEFQAFLTFFEFSVLPKRVFCAFAILDMCKAHASEKTMRRKKSGSSGKFSIHHAANAFR